MAHGNMNQQLVVPTTHALLAELILRRVRKAAAAAGSWSCPACKARTISANVATCFACSQIEIPKE
jgi:hypothetical protein